MTPLQTTDAAEAAAYLGQELSALTAMADSLPWADHSKHSHRWEAISISGLGKVDHHDESWETGRQAVKAGLQSVRWSSGRMRRY